MQHARTYYIPTGAHEIADPKSDAVVYVHKAPTGKLELMGFAGKRQKWDFYFTYGTDAERLQKKVKSYFDARRSTLAYKNEQKAKEKVQRAAGHDLKVGDIMSSSWGYDQTNVDFYQVTKLNGKTMVTLRKIAAATAESETGNAMADKCVAVPDHFTGGEFRSRVSTSFGHVSVNVDYRQSASKWDGKPCYRSWYA